MTESTNSEMARGAEVVALVTAAFAVEQAVENSIDLLWQKPSGDLIGESYVIALAVTLVLTIVRFYQGNTRYLAECYATWHHRELSDGGLVAIPVAHYGDLLAHLAQYSMFVAAGHLIEKDPTHRATAWCVIVALAVDVIWAGLKVVSQTPSNGHFVAWFAINLVGGALIALSQLGSDGLVRAVLLIVLVASLLVDYLVNYRYLYETRQPSRSVSTDIAVGSMQVLRSLLDLPSTIPQSSPSPSREVVTEKLKLVFASLMEHPDQRISLFRRPQPVRLHVGFYVRVRDADVLRPVFRYADPGLVLRNRSWNIGERHLGRAWFQVNDIDSAFSYDDYDRNVLDVDASAGNSSDTDREYYKSAVFASVWCPAGVPAHQRRPIGIICLTADQPAFFSTSVHGALVLGLATRLAVEITSLWPNLAEAPLRDALIGLGDALEVRTGEGAARS